MAETKICSKCKTEHSVENFAKELKRKDGLYPWCKLCLREHRAERYVKRLKIYGLTHKVCSYCKENKSREEFGKTASNNLRPRCLNCEEEIHSNSSQYKRRCGKCKEWKLVGNFYPSRRDGSRSTCIECTKDIPLSLKEYRRDKSLIKYFGITLEQYKDLLDKQKNTCPICLKPLEGISNPVDHAHRGQHEGKIRAILHDRCNRFVMHNHYNSDELKRAAELIDNPLTDWIVPEEYLKSRKKKRKRNGKKLLRQKGRQHV